MKSYDHFLVTGGGGFLGRHMVDALLARGKRVRVIDNFISSPKENFKKNGRSIELVEGDIRNVGDLNKVLKGIEVVYHFAAMRSVVKTIENPILSHEVNATGSLLLLHHAVQHKVKRFIFTSTSSVYGGVTSSAQREEGILRPLSPYGMSKLLAENYAKYYFWYHKLPTTSVRIFNVYGPRQNPESRYSLLIPAVLSKIFKNESPTIDGSGMQERDFTYVGDVIEALLLMLDKRKTYGQVYNLGAGRPHSVNDLVAMMLKITGSSLKAKRGPRRPGDPDRTCADISKARKDFGWTPKTSLKKGLEETIRWAIKDQKAS